MSHWDFRAFIISRSRGSSNPSAEGSLSTLLAHRVKPWRSFFCRGHRGLLGEAGVARLRGRGGSGGARESGSPKNEYIVEDPNRHDDEDYYASVLNIKDSGAVRE